MKTFAEHPAWRGLQGDRLAWEVYKYLADPRTGLFHVNEVLEGDDVLSEYRTIRDPVKIINVYGYAYCAIFGPLMAGIAEGIGLGEGRTLVLPAWNHVATEVRYDGGWHYMDLDLRAVFRRRDGTLASMADARRDASLWTGRGPLFFPNDPLEATRKIYQTTPLDYYHRFHFSGHTMDYVLRQGETFTRWWTPQGGRWHHDPRWNREAWLVRLLEQPPRGPKPNHRHFTVHNYANGRLVYEPNLTDRSSDFDDGVYDAENVVAGPEGLVLRAAGEGYAVFEVRTPYIIVPIVGDRETKADDREASVVELDADRARLSVSVDNGLTWQEIRHPMPPSPPALPPQAGKPRAEPDALPQAGQKRGEAGTARTFDLTGHVAGRYGYLLKITLSGEPAEAVVRGLKITTWVQVAPAALPSLRKGRNVMEYRTGDHYGLPTRVAEIRSAAGLPGQFLKYLVAPPEDYDPRRATARVRGEAVAKVEAPPGTKIAWFSAGANFRTHQLDAARNTRNSIAWAAGRPEGFVEVYRADVPTWTEHWHCNADEKVKLKQPSSRVYVRYVGDPALNNIRIYAHCLEDRPRASRRLVVTHAWSEQGRSKQQRVELDGPGTYEIVADEEPTDAWIELSVPSGGRDRD
jgi:hypothetical protein